MRIHRQRVAESFRKRLSDLHDNYCTSLESNIRWIAKRGVRSEAMRLLGQIIEIDPDRESLTELRDLVGKMEKKGPPTRTELYSISLRLKASNRKHIRELTGLAHLCWQAGLMAYAYDMVWEILKADPTNVVALRALGHQKVGDKWYPPFEAGQLRKGMVHLRDFGWIHQQHAERVKKGEWFDGRQWTTMAAANKLHSERKKPWVIETENFMIKATTDRQKAIRIAEGLENLRHLVFREYLPFFMRSSTKSGTQLLFHKAMRKKLLVYYFANKQQFDELIEMRFQKDAQELLKRSHGFYASQIRGSAFYHLGDRHAAVVVQHEVTHHILYDYATGPQPPVWLAEGLAKFIERARTDKSGRMSLPRGHAHPDIRRAAHLLGGNQLPKLSEFLKYDREKFHERAIRGTNYVMAGAFCKFMLEYENGGYATDFLEFAYDLHARGSKNLFDYVGLNTEALEKAFHAYLATPGK